jgi:RNA polymerase sigma factor (sigma-70 family)
MHWDGVRALIEQAKAGDGDAWRRLYALAQEYVLRLAQCQLGPGWPHRSVSDLTQKAWIRAWQRLGDFRGGPDDAQTGALFRAWLRQIVHTVCLNDHRDNQAAMRNPPAGLLSLNGDGSGDWSGSDRDPPADDPSPSHWLRQDEQKTRVAAALTKLDADERAAVELHILQDWTLGQVADHLGLTYDQVRYRLYNALGRWGASWAKNHDTRGRSSEYCCSPLSPCRRGGSGG